MDLRNLETTTTYAIEALYREYWHIIPERYKLLERAQRTEHGNKLVNVDGVIVEDETKQRKPKSHPLSYSDVEKLENKPLPGEEPIEGPYSDYHKYVEDLNSDQFFDFYPFYDPELSFENRLHYKLVGVPYPQRNFPWYVITWNCGTGLLTSSLTRRRFQSAQVTTPAGDKVKFDFINTDLDLTFAIYCNTMQGLFELQENILVGQREKFVVDTRPHSIVGSFPVSVDTIGSTLTKLDRDKGTLCQMLLNLKVDYPVIGNVQPMYDGIIKEIHTEVDKDGTGPGPNQVVFGRNIIKPDEEE